MWLCPNKNGVEPSEMFCCFLVFCQPPPSGLSALKQIKCPLLGLPVTFGRLRSDLRPKYEGNKPQQLKPFIDPKSQVSHLSVWVRGPGHGSSAELNPPESCAIVDCPVWSLKVAEQVAMYGSESGTRSSASPGKKKMKIVLIIFTGRLLAVGVGGDVSLGLAANWLNCLLKNRGTRASSFYFSLIWPQLLIRNFLLLAFTADKLDRLELIYLEARVFFFFC